MGRYTVISQDAFNELQMDAGVLLRNFDVGEAAASGSSLGFSDEDIICATTGGINIVCQPTYSDFAEDVDNAPNNLMEFKHLDGWNCSMSTTSIGTSLASIRLALGAADIDGMNAKVTPRKSLKLADFKDIWWVGDKANGGFLAVRIMNSLSTDGFSLQTGKNAKGQITLSITGHVSLSAQSIMPMVFYSVDVVTNYTITQTLSHVTSSLSDTSVLSGRPLEATLTAASGYTLSEVTVTMDGGDVTSSTYDSSTHKVSIGAVTGNVVITATATENQ